MATAGDRHEELTGNIWNYANRGDLTGVKAAIHRGVNINIQNTVGWTACHAAAAGGQTKTLRFLVKAGADLDIRDSGGQLPIHHAAKNGHSHALKLLGASGSDLTNVRLSQGKGNAVREVLIEALKKAGKDERYEEEELVGYARKQSKSTAFWGPRRTPISGKIKKKILKERRKKKQQKISAKLSDHSNEYNEMGPEDGENACTVEPKHGHLETVQMVKRGRKNGRRKQKTNASSGTENDEETMTVKDESCAKGSQESFIHNDSDCDDASHSDAETEFHVSGSFQLLHLDDSSSEGEDDG